MNCLFPSSGTGIQLFNLIKDLFDRERTFIISDFLNDNDVEVLLSQNWRPLKLEQVLFQENNYILGFLLWWPTILDKKIINKFNTGVVNFHPSYLPFGRGKDPYFWSIVNDEPFGISCHFIDENIDCGDLIIQKKIVKNWTDTGESLRNKAIGELKSVIRDWVIKILASDYTLEKIVNLSVNYREDMLNKSWVELDSLCTFREFLNLIRAKSNKDHIGIVFSDSDGRFHIKLGRHSLDIRISTMPTQHGEAVVMRLLDQTHGAPKLSDLNMPEAIRTQWERLIHHQHGMLLVTGPTGSGKTTTLYASLDELNHPENKIITIEDPVEYRLPRVNQVQVHEKIGLTFSQVLRTSLRQDPDILLVGEMRDLDTIEVGLRASMTGHLVFSTLHTNSAIGTISRLLDMGANGYLLASSLLGIVAQRLVKKVCSSCAEPYQPDVQQAAWLQGRNINESILFNRGKGCPQCSKTGYQGRVGIYEILEITPAMTDALRKNDLQEFNEAVQANEQYQTLSDQVMDYAIRGITSLDEVIRLSSDSGH